MNADEQIVWDAQVAVMDVLGYSPGEAADWIREQAMYENRSVIDVAGAILAGESADCV